MIGKGIFKLGLAQGFRPLYHSGGANHCPACGRQHWHIGRSTAECAFCATALPLASDVGIRLQPAPN